MRCADLREVYWAKLRAFEEARTHLRHGEVDPHGNTELTALLRAADDERIAARDALVGHREKCRFHI